MNLNSKLTEIKRDMDDLGKQLSAQHTSIIRTLDELKRQGAKPPGLGEPDFDGSGGICRGSIALSTHRADPIYILKHTWGKWSNHKLFETKGQ